jgi:mono/diheme cytochrome c family protein
MLTKLGRSFDHERLLFGGLVVAGFLAMVPAAPAQSKPDKDAIARGQVTYERYCVSCHGKGARGDGSLAKDLRVPVPDLTTLAKRAGGEYPSDRVFRIISKGSEVRGHGTDDMPAWGPAFNHTDGIEGAAVDEAIRNLVQYIGSLQRAR